MTLPKRTVFVTGASGFIGSAVLRRLALERCSIRVLVGPDAGGLAAWPHDVDVEVADITRRDRYRRSMSGAELVVHLAGPPSVAESFERPAEFVRVHAQGTAALLENCRDAGVRRCVYVSSAEIYGQPSTNPVTEDAPTAPLSPYGCAKLAAECLVRALGQAWGIEAIILRPFSIYGPGMSPRSVLSTILDQAERSNVIELADPTPLRDFCYLDDIAEAISAALRVEIEAPLRVFNLGSGVPTSIYDLARAVVEVTGRALPIRQAERMDRPATSRVSELVAGVARAKDELGWHARTSLRDGLQALWTARRTTESAPCSIAS